MIPIGRKVHIRLIDRPQEKKGLIVVNKKYEDQEACLKAEVLAIGRDVMDIAIGDVVLIPGHAGRWIDKDLVNDQNTNRIIEEDEILAILVQAEDVKRLNGTKRG